MINLILKLYLTKCVAIIVSDQHKLRRKHSMAQSLDKNIVGIYRSKKKPHVTQMMEKFTM